MLPLQRRQAILMQSVFIQAVFAAAIGGSFAACGEGDPTPQGASSSQGSGGSASSTGTGATGGGGAGGIGGAGGVGGAGGAGGVGGVGGAGGAGGASGVCVPGSTQTCYGGPPSTNGVGACKAGTQTCNADGMGYGVCVGEVQPAIENCQTPEDEDCNGSSMCPIGMGPWSKRFGDGAEQSGQGIAIDGTGHVLLAGTFAGTLDLGGGPLSSAGGDDIFVAKFSPDGELIWSKRIGGAQNQGIGDIAVDAAGNTWLTGSCNGTIDLGAGAMNCEGTLNVFVAKLDPSGAPLFGKLFGSAAGQYSQSSDIAVDGAGNIVVTGYFTGQIDFGGGPLSSQGAGWDVFVAKLSSTGQHVFSSRFGDGDDQMGFAVAFSPNGDVIVGGHMKGAPDFGGGALASAGGDDIFVARLSPGGAHIASKRFGGTGNDGLFALATDAAGNVVTTGFYRNMVDFGGGALVGGSSPKIFVTKLDPSFAHISSKGFGNQSGYGNKVMVDSAGNTVVSGTFQGSIDFGGGVLNSAGGNDIFVATLSSAGAHLSSARFGDASGQYGAPLARDAADHIFMTGSFAGAIDLGTGPLTSAGGLDVFVGRLSP